MIRRLLIIGFVIACGVSVASAGTLTTGVGTGSSGGGTFTPSFLLINAGSILLIDSTPNKMEIHG